MGKNKKIYKIPLFTLLALVLLSSIALLSLQNQSVQTWLFDRLAGKFSRNNEIELTASMVRFTFFNKIKVNDLLIKDNTADTMLYAPELKAGIRKIDRKNRFISLRHIDIEKPVIYLRPDTNNILNLQYFAQLLINEDTAKRNKDLLIRQIIVNDGTLRYNSGKSPDTAKGFDINNIALSRLNLQLDNLDKHYKDLNLTITDLSFDSDKGPDIANLFTDLIIEDNKFSLRDPTIRTEKSFINSDLISLELLNQGDDFNFISDARLRINFQSSLLSLSELSEFIEPVKGINKDIILSGDISGTIGDINGRDIFISYSDSTMLLCDFDLSGLPDIHNTFMFISIDNLTSTTKEISEFEISGKEKLNLGDKFRNLGAVSFSGNFTGFIQDFVTYGTINTELGALSTDILFRPDTSDTFYYKGTLEGKSVDLGKVFDNDMLGPLTVEFDVEGTSKTFKNFRADLNGTVESLEINDYKYEDIRIEGLITDNIWDGVINSNTDDLKMDLLGRFDFSNEKPEFDFTFNLLEADLYKLNIDRSDSILNLSMLLTASLQGNGPEDINGSIRLLNSRLKKGDQEFNLFDCSIDAYDIDSTEKQVELRTDLVDADIRGIYNLNSIIPDLKYTISNLFPSVISGNNNPYSGDNSFDYQIRIKNTDEFNKYFNTGLLLAPGLLIEGSVRPDNLITVNASGDYLTYELNSMSEFNINCSIKDTIMDFDLGSSSLTLANRLNLEQFHISSDAVTDNFDLTVSWDNPSEDENNGMILATGEFSVSDSVHKKLNLGILPADLMINGNNWHIEESSLIIDSNAISVDNFTLRYMDEYFSVDGKVSGDPSDSIEIEFNKLNLAGLNKLERKRKTANEKKTEFILEGLLSGNIILTDIYNDLMFETDITVSGFQTNDHSHGDVMILSQWNNDLGKAGLNVSNNKNGKNTFNVTGDYKPAESELNLTAAVDSMPLDILNIFLNSFASDVKGYGYGEVFIENKDGNLTLNGSVLADNASMTIDYLQSNFKFADSIYFDNNSLLFKNINLKDNKDNNAVLDGSINHSNFKDFLIDLRVEADNVLVFDTRPVDNDIFYGTAYASGLILINGPANNLNFNISARTERNTRMFFPLSSEERIDDYTFIKFRNPDTTERTDIPLNIPVISQNEERTIALSFELDVTPDADIQLVFDSKLGDVMQARGSGTLNMELNEEGDFSLYGDYIIENGEYQLTLGNIFNKRFTVEQGGSISWNGDILDANVDIKAIYRLKASLEDLFQDDAYSSRIPVECHLNMTGQLANPIIGFDIYLPTADETTRTYLRDAIDSEEEMSRQFLYLLVMNSFYPDPAMAVSSPSTSAAGASAMGVTTTEMLSNQLSNWLSQISSDFDIGFTYRPGNEISSQEVEVALSTQLLNDRVVINGNFDVGGQETTSSTNEITGDFNVEVKLTDRIRFKVFNRSNDNLVYETAPYTQGFGLFYRQSFDNLGDLFRNKKSEMKREEDPEIIEE